jgi:ribosome-associated protein
MDQIMSLTQHIHDALGDKKAQDIVVLSVKGISSFADYFIIATGTSTTHMNGLADGVEEALEKLGITMKHKEGRSLGGWLLLDYRDVIVHIFNAETRDYYALERIWNDATRLKL